MRFDILSTKRVNQMSENDSSGGSLEVLVGGPILWEKIRIVGKDRFPTPGWKASSEGSPMLEATFSNLSKYTSTGRSTGEQVVTERPICPGYDGNLKSPHPASIQLTEISRTLRSRW